jgi:DNA-binding NarL/FixJ family response regulator
LERLGDEVEVIEASDLDEALELARQEDRIDLVVLDLTMPGREGLAGLRSMIDLSASTPVVVINASENPKDVMDAIGLGAKGYIPKSTAGRIALNAFKLVLSGGAYIPASAFCRAMEPERAGRRAGLQEPVPVEALLTPRQRDVLTLIGTGKSNKEIGRLLGVSEGTVKLHVTNILRFLKVRNRTEAALLARKRLPLEDESARA